MENISEVVESSTWAHRCSRFQLSRRPFRAKCKLSSLSLRASAILTQSNDDAWFNFYPFNVINDKLSPFRTWNSNLFVEKRLLLQVFSRGYFEIEIETRRKIPRYKSNCGRLLQQQHQFDNPPTRRGIQKVYLILTSGFLLFRSFKRQQLTWAQTFARPLNVPDGRNTHSSKRFVITGARNQQIFCVHFCRSTDCRVTRNHLSRYKSNMMTFDTSS